MKVYVVNKISFDDEELLDVIFGVFQTMKKAEEYKNEICRKIEGMGAGYDEMVHIAEVELEEIIEAFKEYMSL